MPVTVELDDSGEYIYIDSDWRYNELCKSIPGTNWRPKEGPRGMWRMPVSWGGCLALRSTFRNDLVVGDKLTAWAINERAIRIDPANAVRELLDTTGDADLMGHQRAGVAFLSVAKRALLADEPGTGKTATAIRTLKELERRGENPFPALIVCPNTLKTNWKREFEKWWPDVDVQVISGTATQRRKQFDRYLKAAEGDAKPQVFVVNYESLRSHSRLAPYGGTALTKCVEHGGVDESISAVRCEVHLRELNHIDFRTVIADEIHRAKDPKSKQTRALWAASGDAEYRIAMTGTPIAHNVVDMWSILHWLDEKEWPTRSKWIDRSVDTMLNGFGGMYILGLKATMRDEFFAAVAPRFRRTLKAAVLTHLPPILHEERTVEMGVKQKKAYNQMAEKMIAELSDGSILTAPSPLTQMSRLLQFSVASAEIDVDPTTGEEHVRLTEPSATLDALMNDIENGDFGDDSIAISSASKQLINLISAKMNSKGILHGMITGDVSPDVRQKSIDEFQEGKIKYILYTVQAGGVGVTLTKARRLIRVLRPWSLIDDKQSNDRVHRIGSEQHDSIIITDYIVEGTVQQRVQNVLDGKDEQAESVMNDRETILRIAKGES